MQRRKRILITGASHGIGKAAAEKFLGTGCEPKPIHIMSSDTARRILEVNLFGTALCMKYECISMMSDTGGVILNNSSVSAYKAATGTDIIYSASKAGVLRLTAEAAASKLYRDRIKFFHLFRAGLRRE